MFEELAELPAGARGAEPGRRRRAHVRDLLVRHRRSRGDRRRSSPTRSRDRRHRPSHPAGRAPGRSRGPDPRALKHIPAERLVISSDCGMGREGMGRRHALQDGVDRARHQHRAQGTGTSGSRVPRRRRALLAHSRGALN